jgi:FkbM family methyltransferase
VTRLLRKAVKRLDRPGGRTLLGVLASIRLTAKLRRPTFVRWHDGAWIYRWSEAKVVPHPVIGAALHPEEARDIFLHTYVPTAGDVVFDVGAGVGDTALLFSDLVGESGQVVAIEAHPDTFAWLVRLCELNDLKNVTPLQLAVSDHEGEVLISDDDSVSNTLLESRDDESRITVRARRLDDIANGLEIERIDFLKMNIEGAERAALGGMEEMIRKTRHVCISCHDFMADRGGSDQMRTKAFVSDFLAARGFSLATRDRGADSLRSYVYGTNTVVR